ncbi:MAG: efflux RND transporter periplasmic adaptor subunit [Desulfomonilaceae bacterium]|nr:efflux RND transporter periplasmic adaptor subunit [Desulfomonilaceae bacterium]
MHKKKIIAGTLLLISAVAGVAGWYYYNADESAEGRVFVSGNIETTEVDLSFRLAGQIKKLNVEEGDRVKKGAVIAELDTDTQEALKRIAQAEIAALRAVLDELEEGTRKEHIAMARAVMKAAESRLENAKDEHKRYSQLFQDRAISASQYDRVETSLKVAREEYNNAAQRLSELETGPREQQIRAARHRLERARAELLKIELDIEHSILTTPVSGVILVKANEVGEVVLPGATVATVAELDEVWLKGYVGERYLGLLKLGQKAEITIDTFSHRIFPGTLTYISSRAEFTPKNVQTREERIKQVYRVKITMPNQDHALKIGMPAEGYLLVDKEAEGKGGEAQRAEPKPQ